LEDTLGAHILPAARLQFDFGHMVLGGTW